MKFADDKNRVWLSLESKARTKYFEFHGIKYEIQVTKKSIDLVGGHKRQYLGESINGVGIVWAGDLDGDGKLDFVVSRESDKSGNVCLFLSGAASAEEIAGRVDCLEVSG
jgi:hypothetical protein